MGCASVVTPSITKITNPYKQWINSAIGILAITLLGFSPQQDQSFSIYSNKLTHAKLKVSNQTQFTKMNNSSNEGIQTQISDLNTFIINSCYQSKGRFVQIEAQDKTFLLGSYIGKGYLSLDRLINNQASQQCNCQLYQNQRVKGVVKMRITFIPQSYQILSFIFIDLFILYSRKDLIQQRKTFIRIQIGEQILQTQPKLQNKKSLPNWVPDFISTGTITIYQIIREKFIQVGKKQISLPNIMQEDGQRLFISDITQQNKLQITASLKYSTIKGENPKYQKQPSFRIPKYKKKISPQRQAGIILNGVNSKENPNVNEQKHSSVKKKLMSNEKQNIHLLKTQP